MRATFTEEQEALASAARDLAAGGLERARALLEGRQAADEPTASLLAGYSGLAVPEARGGAGGTLVDLAIVLEALGRTVTPTPWVSHVLAIQVGDGCSLDVADAASGAARLVLAVNDSSTAASAGPAQVRDGLLDGQCLLVRDAEGADAIVVVLDDGEVALAVPSETRTRRPFDPTRPAADVLFDRVDAVTCPGGAAVLRRAIVAVAAELVGVGRGAIDLAVAYARSREQFGQPIGRFQGVAHQLADAWTDVELSWSLTLHACWAVDDDDAGAARATHAAKSTAGAAAIHAAERSTQVHGGIGVTWEGDPHLYLRRALADDAWLGTSRQHRRWLGDAIVASG